MSKFNKIKELKMKKLEKPETSEHKGNISLKIVSIIGLLISIITLIFSIVWNFYQDQKIDVLTYNNNAIQYRPILKIMGVPEDSIFYLFGPNNAIKDLIRAEQIDSILSFVPNKIGIKFNLNIKNFGTSIAKLYNLIWLDTLSGSTEIRKSLLNKDSRDMIFKLDSSKEFYNTRDIFPSDSTKISFSHIVHFIKDKEFTIHILLLYSNELDILYDTYYWFRYNVNDFKCKPRVKFAGNKRIIDYIYKRDQLFSLLKFHDSNSSPYIYRKEEAEEILNFLDNVH